MEAAARGGGMSAKESKFSDDARIHSHRIAVQIEALIRREVKKLGNADLCAAVHATVVGLLQGAHYVTLKDFCTDSGMDSKEASDYIVSMIDISAQAADVIAQKHGIKIQNSVQIVIEEKEKKRL